MIRTGIVDRYSCHVMPVLSKEEITKREEKIISVDLWSKMLE